MLAATALPVLATVRVLDDRGQEVSLNASPRRIISLYGGITEILQALGAGPRIVARTRGDETLPDLPTVGTHLQPNLEMILALNPDLVLQGGVKKGLLGVKRLEQEGVPVAVFAPRDFSGLFTTIKRLGQLTGTDDLAGVLVRDMEDRLQEVARKVSGRPRPKVFFEVRYHNLLAAGQGSLVNDIIIRAGGQNIVTASQKLVSFSLETLIKEDPAVYIIQKGPMNRSPQDIKARPHYELLQAVKGGRVLVVEESLFSRPGPRSVEAVELLTRFLHPDAIK
jgi:iron complex transport system substrate-binding protein